MWQWIQQLVSLGALDVHVGLDAAEGSTEQWGKISIWSTYTPWESRYLRIKKHYEVKP